MILWYGIIGMGDFERDLSVDVREECERNSTLFLKSSANH